MYDIRYTQRKGILFFLFFTGQNSLLKLFIKFQDKDYEGSTYTLYYIAEKDALMGYYYQAFMDRTYEVVFLRKR